MTKRMFIGLLLCKALFAMLWIGSETVGLVPDEAQYWTRSQQLDWGYYSKPPGIAWQIALGTAFFGNTELGVRSVSVILSFLLAISVYQLAKSCKLSPKGAAWAGVVMALTPLGVLGSLMAVTDGGMVLFWTLGCLYILSRDDPSPYILGGLIALGALFKWPIYLLWLFALPFCRRNHLVGGMALSLLGLLPSIIWNASHDWATFRHVGSTILGGHGAEVGTMPLGKGNLFDFLGAQMLLLSPLFFGLLLLGFYRLIKEWNVLNRGIRFCGTTTFIILICYTIFSLFTKMQGNWCVFAYPTGIVLLTWFAYEQRERWLWGGLVVSLLVVLVGLFFPLPYSMSPFRHQLGWSHLPKLLTTSGYDPDEHFLFGDKYQMSSILSFYGPGQRRAYFLNLHGARHNQFSFWPSMLEEQMGKTGYYVLAENTRTLDPTPIQSTLEEYFTHVDVMGVFPIYWSRGEVVKQALIIRCEGYNGKQPPDPQKY